MDNQNTTTVMNQTTVRRVLILVLMDNQNTWNTLALGGQVFVLILVLMDNQNTVSMLVALICAVGLNPCSNG